MAIINKKKEENLNIRVNSKVKMIATAGHPYYKAEHPFTVHPSQKAKLLANGWAVEDGASVKDAKEAKEIKKSETAPAAGSTNA